MSATAVQSQPDHARRIEELGRIIMAYSEVAERLRQWHDRLNETVLSLRTELGEKNRLLERKNRLAALGGMAAGMAHEIRNPLGGIQLYASILARDVADRPESPAVVRKIAGGVKRLEALAGQVLRFTRVIRANACLTDLPEVLEEAVELAGPALRDRGLRCVARRAAAEARDGRPAADRTGRAQPAAQRRPGDQGNRLLSFRASRRAASVSERAPRWGRRPVAHARGSLAIPVARRSTGRRRLPRRGDGRRARWHDDRPLRRRPVVSARRARDGGPGIPPQVLDRIFNPFFVTKDTGTGLGLAIVHRVVEAHDGTIVVTNPDSGGARFEIRI